MFRNNYGNPLINTKNDHKIFKRTFDKSRAKDLLILKIS